MEPSENRVINSILSTAFPNQEFATEPFNISTVLPQRTFLEKIFLLYDISQKAKLAVSTFPKSEGCPYYAPQILLKTKSRS
jgi:hypothetical protein